ncbi:hypothetical protein Aduo_009540 [Ancylostoma duodenale]
MSTDGDSYDEELSTDDDSYDEELSTDGDSYDEEKDFLFNYWGDGTPMDANGNPKVFFKEDTEEGMN